MELTTNELETLKNDLLAFIHRVSGENGKTNAEVQSCPQW